MKTRLAAFLVVAIVVPGCFDDTPPGNITFNPSREITLKAARLSGRQEVPPNLSIATADATLVVRADLLSVDIIVNFSGLVGPTDAHIHVGGIGVDGPIIFPLALGGFTSPIVVKLDQFNLIPQPSAGIFAFGEAVNAMLTGRTYVNLHTAAFPGGEIRGQVGPVEMAAQLNGQQEVPSVLTTATGQFSVTMSNDQSTMTFMLWIQGLSNVTAAHIHVAPAQVDGPIIFPLAIGAFQQPLGGTLTVVELTPQALAGVATFEEAVDAVLSGNTYVNVHTGLYPEGEIRGQILGFVPLNPPPPPIVPTLPPITVVPPIPGYPNTVGTIIGTPTPQGFPATGAPTPTTLNPGITVPGSPGVTLTPGTPATTTPPPVTVVGPYYSR